MSEFTAGLLFLKNGQVEVEIWVKSKGLAYYLRELNQKWATLLLEDQFLSKAETISAALELSKILPMASKSQTLMMIMHTNIGFYAIWSPSNIQK